MPMPSWNMTILVIFLIGIAFGYILQRDKIIATLFAVYVSLIISQTFSGPIQQFFRGDRTFGDFWINANISPFTINTVLFIAVIALLSIKVEFSISNKARGILSPLEIILYSIMTTGLIMTTIFNFMTNEMKDSIIQNSNFAQIITANYVWWIALPVIFMIITSLFNKKKVSAE